MQTDVQNLPPKQQVISIHPDGSLSGLQRKPGQGIDLRPLGNADVQRASDIRWHEQRQLWYIHLLKAGSLSGRDVTVKLCAEHTNLSPRVLLVVPHCGETDGLLLWPEYDHAVAFEIRFMDALRLQDPSALDKEATPQGS